MDLRILTEPQQGATYDDLLAVARVAEEEGYDASCGPAHDVGAVGSVHGQRRVIVHPVPARS